MLSAVLDVNVLISAMIMRRGFPYQLFSAWRTGRFTVVTSEHIITQLIMKLRSDKLRRYGVTTGDLRTVASSLRNDGIIVEVPASDIRPVTGDPEDDAVLTTARLGQADYLVTGDGGLLALGTYEGTTITTPRAFFDLLNR